MCVRSAFGFIGSKVWDGKMKSEGMIVAFNIENQSVLCGERKKKKKKHQCVIRSWLLLRQNYSQIIPWPYSKVWQKIKPQEDCSRLEQTKWQKYSKNATHARWHIHYWDYTSTVTHIHTCIGVLLKAERSPEHAGNLKGVDFQTIAGNILEKSLEEWCIK